MVNFQMINYDSNFEKKKRDFEKGIISIYDLDEEEIAKLTECYEKEIASNNMEIEMTKSKIKNLKKKIDSIV